MYNFGYMKRLSNNYISHLLVAISYVLLAILATWPLTTHLATHFPTSSLLYGGDPNVFIWYIDWIAKSVAGTTAADPGLMIFYPQGIDVFSGYDGPLVLAVALPAIWLSGNPVLAYNIFILSAFIFTALATYALLRYLTGSLYASVIGGFIFGFSPYMMVRATLHPNLIMLGVIPLLALATIRFYRAPKIKNTLWLGGAALLSALSSWYYALGGIMFIALAFIISSRTLIKRLKITLAACLIVVLALLLPALPMILSETGGQRATNIDHVRAWGLRPINLIVPHPFMNAFTDLAKPIYMEQVDSKNGPNIIELSNYMGLVMVALMAAFYIRRKNIEAREAALWTTTFAAFLILALGISLKLNGTDIPMPFAALHELFPYSSFRVPNRFFVYALLAGTVLSAYYLRRFREILKKRKMLLSLATVLLATLLVSERMIFPFPLMKHRVPAFYNDIAQDPEAYAIADLPFIYPGVSQYNYFQTIHGKPIVTGEFFYTAYSDRLFSYLESNPLLSAGVCRKSGPREAAPDDIKASMDDLHSNNVRYVVIHNLILQNIPDCANAYSYIRDFFRQEDLYFTDGEITVFRVSDYMLPQGGDFEESGADDKVQL